MHEPREHLPFEWAFVAIAFGLCGVLTFCIVAGLYAAIRASLIKPWEIKSPYLTKDLREKLKSSGDCRPNSKP